jgi:polysaccharide biosynthesis/export protein
MDKYKIIIILIISSLSLVGCDKLLEPVKLDENNYQQKILSPQDNFEIKIKPLTLVEALKNNNAFYARHVQVHGRLESANLISENSIINTYLPPQSKSEVYLLGLGDELTLTRSKIFPNQENQQFLNNSNFGLDTQHIQSTAEIGSDGNILLLGLGKIQAQGKSLNEVRAQARNILIRNGESPNFQLEISNFRSRKAYVFSPRINKIVDITNRPLTLRELAASDNFLSNGTELDIILLNRQKNIYKLTKEELFRKDRKEIYIQDKDQIEFLHYKYNPGKVYTLTAGRAKIIPINPEIRESLADVLFNPGGALSSGGAKRSEIYLLRGQNPVNAFHLDAQKTSRILIASKMELRPEDIIYVAERPIVSLTRFLSEVSPLRGLLRDIRNRNIP